MRIYQPIFLTIMLVLPVFNIQAKELSFERQSGEVVNPERGLLSQADTFPQTSKDALPQSYFESFFKKKITLYRRIYYLHVTDAGKYQDINDAKAFIEQELKNIRGAGMKVVLRFAYAKKVENGEIPHVEKLSEIENHITKLKTMLADYWDVIAALEIGFIGVYGENFFTSGDFGKRESSCLVHLLPEFKNRVTLVEKVLAIVPSNRYVLLRYPSLKQNLVSKSAYLKQHQDRLGFFNDCFMGNNTDAETFCPKVGEDCKQNPGSECGKNDRSYLESETKKVPLLGETCNNPQTKKEKDIFLIYGSKWNLASAQLKRFHWSALNIDQGQQILGTWNGGKFNEAEVIEKIGPYLGYRFVLQEQGSSINWTRKSDGTWNVILDLKITNEGSAAPFNPRNLVLEYQKCETQQSCEPLQKEVLFDSSAHNQWSDYNPRNWEASKTISLKATLNVAKSGTYNIFLRLPDPMLERNSQLQKQIKARYAIQFANKNVWQKEEGNNLIASVKIEDSNN